MGSDKTKDPSAYDDEQPQHRVNLGEYWLGKTEVTVEQFVLFVKTTGYAADTRAFRSGKEKHPVNYVSWDDAVAFCKWVSDRSKLTVRLPSEAEWEKGARGTDGRIYAWGNQAIDRSRANYVDAKVGDTTAVGKYSSFGDSLYGLQDMIGNVWEWTSSLYKPYPYNANDGRESDSSRDARVLRGGSFSNDDYYVRCAFRNYHGITAHSDYIGFRGCVPHLSNL